MRWEKHSNYGEGKVSFGPGKRWGHTCNSIKGGKFLYVFGGYGKDNRHTNQIHIFDAANRIWSEPVMNGEPPVPRDSHSCTTVEDNLFIFGGTDGMNPLKDLHIFHTSSNTWSSPCIRGEGPEAREGHSAALVGKRLFIFGGCARSSDSSYEEYYDDLYILNIETFVWKRAETSGTPPVKRDSHTCSSWKNKIIVIGGEDLNNYYLSDVHILDTDSLIWGKLNTTGQLLPPRAGHTTVAFGKNLFVFGGFSDEHNLFDDMYMLDVETGCWTKVMATGEGPSARFSMAGDCLDMQKEGVLVFVGGCNKNLEALDDIYYLMTGIPIEPERDERRIEKLSLRKQLRLKCQEQQTVAPVHDKALSRTETNVNASQYVPPTNHIQPSRQNIYLHKHQTPLKRPFQAKIIKCLQEGYTIETVIDGKLLRGVIFSTKTVHEDLLRKRDPVKIDGAKPKDDDKTNSESPRSSRQKLMDDRQADGVQENSGFPDNQVPGDIRLSVAPNAVLEDINTIDVPYSSTKETAFTPLAAARVASPLKQDSRTLTAEAQSLLIGKSSGSSNLISVGDSIQLRT